MILVDTSIWVDHLRAGDEALRRLLRRGLVLGHPSVTGELALGHLTARREILLLLSALPSALVVTDQETLLFIEQHKLSGRGIGYVDVALLAAARMTPEAQLWTRDRRLAENAERLGLAVEPSMLGEEDEPPG